MCEPLSWFQYVTFTNNAACKIYVIHIDKCYKTNLGNIMLNEEAKHNRSHTVYFHLCEIYSISKSVETESRFVVARGSGERGMGSDCLVGMRHLWR